MKKVTFMVVALSILLCATSFADGLLRTTMGQKAAVTFLVGQYISTQHQDTRVFIRNLDPNYTITLFSAKLFTPDGVVVEFYCDKGGNNGLNYTNLVDPNSEGETITLEPRQSKSISVGRKMLADDCSDWEYPQLDTAYKNGGRPFVELEWRSMTKVVSPEIFGLFRTTIPDGAPELPDIRITFDRFEARIIEEYTRTNSQNQQ